MVCWTVGGNFVSHATSVCCLRGKRRLHDNKYIIGQYNCFSLTLPPILLYDQTSNGVGGLILLVVSSKFDVLDHSFPFDLNGQQQLAGLLKVTGAI